MLYPAELRAREPIIPIHFTSDPDLLRTRRLSGSHTQALSPGTEANDAPVGQVGSGNQQRHGDKHGKSADTRAYFLFACAPQGNGTRQRSERKSHRGQEEDSRPRSQVSQPRNQIIAGEHETDHNRYQAQHRQ